MIKWTDTINYFAHIEDWEFECIETFIGSIRVVIIPFKTMALLAVIPHQGQTPCFGLQKEFANVDEAKKGAAGAVCEWVKMEANKDAD